MRWRHSPPAPRWQAPHRKDGLLSILDRARIGRSAAAQGGELPAIPLLSQTATTTRENVDVPLSREHPVHFCPGMGGGVEWNGAAFSPRCNSLFVDAENGCVRWKFKAPHPVIAGVTPTGGDLVFTADLGGDIFALDQRNGLVLWQISTDQSIGGGLVIYRAGGHEFLGVASGMKSFAWPGSADHSRILIYGLP